MVFRDTATLSPFRDVLFQDEPNLMDDHIDLDSPVGNLGCCCCCLQIISQAQSFDECLKLYDQLLLLTGIMVCCCCFTNIVLEDEDLRILVSSE